MMVQAESLMRVKAAARGGEVVQRTTVNKRDGTQIVTEVYTRPEWTASAWYLERKFPDLFARRDRVDATVRKEAERVAKELGVSIEEFLIEAQRAHEARAKS